MATDIVHGAHSDNVNQVYSVLGVIGTLGTADTKATAQTLPIGVNPDNGAMYVDVLDTTFNVGTLSVGTINKVGTVTEITNGSIVVTAGTMAVNSIGTIGTIQSGTVSVNTPGTITSGSIVVTEGTGIITSGSIAVTAGTIGTIANIGTIGTITNVGTLKSLIVDTTGADMDLFKQGDNFAIGADHGLAVLALADGTPKKYQFLRANTDGDLSIDIDTGTVTRIGSIDVIGTMPAISMGNIPGGTLNAATVSVNTQGTIASGSIVVTDGTVKVTTPGTITSGTITSVGTTVGVGTITNIGTLDMLKAGTITTLSSVSTVVGIGTLTNQGTLDMLKGGTINAGTIGTVANIGTLSLGTINAATINAGTIKNDGRAARNLLTFATTQVFTGSAFATIVGSAAVGVGTSIWVNDLSIVNHNGTVQAGMMFGSAINGNAVIAKGQFGPQGGIEKHFPLAVNGGLTNLDLNCWSDAAGTVTFNVSYFISA